MRPILTVGEQSQDKHPKRLLSLPEKQGNRDHSLLLRCCAG